MIERKIAMKSERPAIEWIDESATEAPTVEGCFPYTMRWQGSPPRIDRPRSSEPRLSEVEAFVKTLVNGSGVEDAAFIAGFLAGERLREIGALVASATFRDETGRPSTIRNPGKVDAMLRSLGASISWRAGRYSIVSLFILTKTVTETQAIEAGQAPARILDRALEDHDLRLFQYGAGLWRSGFVVDTPDPRGWRYFPRATVGGERRATTLIINPIGEMSAEELIERAERIDAPPEVQMPPQPGDRDRGVVRRVIDHLRGGH